ncbi:dUTP diphosphatase [Acholeplasma sp. OttesenSCG-928-E16]|nr:dUTP diphosphatase [Acholeplasma sp. OttesenSCG-928-E16]
MRAFEVISKYQEKNINLPKRSTKYSAGYDIESAEDITINPKEICMVPTGLKVKLADDEVLFIYNRSSMGAKRNLMLPNGVGVIDADYYNNEENEGAISVLLYNFGDTPQEIKKGERIAQGIFSKYLKTIDDIPKDNLRSGGFGSSGK